ncbi:MAG TPA: alanine racemase [Abditibacteriaceae bacterium]|jgi:alanine racemase
MNSFALPSVSSFPQRSIFDARTSRPTVAEIDLAALRHNLAAIAARVGESKIMGVVKANAYGHGLIRVAQEMQSAGVAMLGVAFVEEGIALRQNGIDIPILVLGGIIGEQIGDFLDHNLSITASSVWKLEQIEATARERKQTASVHLKIDTGMERLGIHHYNAAELFEAASRAPHCRIDGVFSHLAASQEQNGEWTRLQLARFEEATAWFPKNSEPMPPRHLANSGAILNSPETFFDIVRPGLMSYGLYPSGAAKTVELQPVLAWKTRVVYFKVVPKGARVGYDGTWTAPHDTRVVTLPVGYGDGFRRSLSNNGEVIIRGVRYPVVGIVSMDQITVDIGPDGTAYNDDEVVLIGTQGSETISVDNVACKTETISYEVLTGIHTRVPRTYHNEM